MGHTWRVGAAALKVNRVSPDAIQQALSFCAAIGKKPVYLKKELPGHVGNRLQAALYREVMYLIQQDVLSVEDADVAVSYGPGLRWGVMGPSLQWHLAGGAGGIKHFMDPLAGVIKSLGTPDITSEAQANDRRRSIARSRQAFGNRTRWGRK